MDFFEIRERQGKGTIEVFPDFKVGRSKDLMLRAGGFYAVYDEAAGLWSDDEYAVQRLVDAELFGYADELRTRTNQSVIVKAMSDFSSGSWVSFKLFMSKLSDNSKQLDESITFANTIVKKRDYISRRLSYNISEGGTPAYDELMDTLYSEVERTKIEWAIGSIVSGDSKRIQKFLVFYGEPGTGKSTVLNLVQRLFEGYYTTFEAKALTSANNAFATEMFRGNPLIAIQHEGDLSKIEDNSKMNSIVSHDDITINIKHRPQFTMRMNALLFMATNKPVKITDSKSGLIRRLIDIHPTGNRVPPKRYSDLIAQIEFELGAIAAKCQKVFLSKGINYYNTYKPMDMIYQTDVFFNFVESQFDVFKREEYITLAQAWEAYKVYCDDALVEYKMPRHRFREELKAYFSTFYDVTRIDSKQVRSVYSSFLTSKFGLNLPQKEEEMPIVYFDSSESLLDKEFEDCSAQYANSDGLPTKKWINVRTKLRDLDTTKLHYVKFPSNHIVIDLDLRDENGQKSLQKNLDYVTKFPPTYSEVSKSGQGIHLHYNFDGDTNLLSRVFEPNIEILVFTGDYAVRRMRTVTHNIPVATISTGLPLRGEKVIHGDVIKTEKGLRTLLLRNIRKEIHSATRPSIDFIWQILEDASASGLVYDVTDMRSSILSFAANSTNQAEYCLRKVASMKFESEKLGESDNEYANDALVFFDVEVYPNLFVVCWKYENDPTVVRMINPSASDVESLMKQRLIGFNCRRYDNHILYGRLIGYNLSELYALSKRIISNSRSGLFREAYSISYGDVYDFATDKKSLKQWELDLGLKHKEIDLPWDEDVSEDLWSSVTDYCINDVEATEEVFHNRKEDWVARLILAELAGMTPNDSTQSLAAKIVFGNDPKPQDKFVYTDLSITFPGYKFDNGKSTYKGIEVGEGGYVYSKPGVYENVIYLDVESMHPTSIVQLNAFGPYTSKFAELKAARLAIKHKEFDLVKTLLNGILTKFLDSLDEVSTLAYSLKIAINIVYGLTAASFDNKFRDPRNKDNIVAKRGALFMIDLQEAVEKAGYNVIHIKTDSIKIADGGPDSVEFVNEFAEKYGYHFTYEGTYEKLCLVNDAVFIAKWLDGKSSGKWTATGAQFAHPFVFKTLFSKEPVLNEDLPEGKAVSTKMYLNFNEGESEDSLHLQFVGKVGRFIPVKPGCSGGILLREKEGNYHAVTGTKQWRWKEYEVVKTLNLFDEIDMSYYRNLVDASIDSISKYGDFNQFAI
jgi:hypothetical protein